MGTMFSEFAQVLRSVGVVVACASGLSHLGCTPSNSEDTRSRVDPLIFAQKDKLTAADTAAGDNFGRAVALSGDTVLIGASRDVIGANKNQGSAYVFVRSGGTWTEQAKLVASDGAAGDFFGLAVALDGDWALVGAQNADVGANALQGAAYVFTRAGTSWSEHAKLVSADGAATDLFGISVAIDTYTAVVGAQRKTVGSNLEQGAAYVFDRAGNVWTQQAKLTSSDGAANDFFGTSVAIRANTAIVGAIYDDFGSMLEAGSAYVFERAASTWTEKAKLVAADPDSVDQFGNAIAVSGNTVLIGAFSDSFPGASNQGSAYVFVGSGASWTQQAKLSASDGSYGDAFGTSVALFGDTALVGAHFDDNGTIQDQGSAYIFARTGTAWTEQSKLLAKDGAATDHFGFAVALSSDAAWVGAHQSDPKGGASGSAYVFELFGADGDQCSSAAECASGYCVDGVCCDVACGGGSADDCQACSVAAGASTSGKCSILVSGTTCRPSAGSCDFDEKCNGNSALCPPDVMLPAGLVCRAAAGECDIAESCSGGNAACPVDAFVADGTACVTGTCTAGACLPPGTGGTAGAGGAAGASSGGTSTGGTGTAGVGTGATNTGGGGTAGVAGTGGAAGASPNPDDDGGCGCRTGRSRDTQRLWLIARGMGVVALRRRSRAPRSRFRRPG